MKDILTIEIIHITKCGKLRADVLVLGGVCSKMFVVRRLCRIISFTRHQIKEDPPRFIQWPQIWSNLTVVQILNTPNLICIFSQMFAKNKIKWSPIKFSDYGSDFTIMVQKVPFGECAFEKCGGVGRICGRQPRLFILTPNGAKIETRKLETCCNFKHFRF